MKLPETSTSAPVADRQNTIKGMAYISVTAFCGALANAMIRHLSFTMHPLEIVFFRCLFGLVVFIPILMRQGLLPLKSKRPKLLLLRGLLQVVQLTFCRLLTLPDTTGQSCRTPFQRAVVCNNHNVDLPRRKSSRATHYSIDRWFRRRPW